MPLDKVLLTGILPNTELCCTAPDGTSFNCLPADIPLAYGKCIVTYMEVRKGWASIRLRWP